MNWNLSRTGRVSLSRRRCLAKGIDVGLAAAATVIVWLLPLYGWELLAALVIVVVYPALAEWVFGATAGKWACGLRVTRANGERPPIWRTFVRNVAQVVPPIATGVVLTASTLALRTSDVALGFIVGVAFVLSWATGWLIPVVADLVVMLRRPDVRALHDLLAGTTVRFAGEVPSAPSATAPDSEASDTAPAWRRLAARSVDFAGCGGILLSARFMGSEVLELVVWLAALVAYPVLSHRFFGRTLGKHLLGIQVVHHGGGQLSVWRASWRWLAEVVPVVIVVAAAFGFSVWILWEINEPADDESGWGGFILALLVVMVATFFSLFGIVVALAIDSLVAFTNARRRTLHDLLGGTRVVLLRPRCDRLDVCDAPSGPDSIAA